MTRIRLLIFFVLMTSGPIHGDLETPELKSWGVTLGVLTSEPPAQRPAGFWTSRNGGLYLDGLPSSRRRTFSATQVRDRTAVRLCLFIISAIMKTPKFLTIYFDNHRPEPEKAGGEQQDPPTDYSPLPRVTLRSLGMGALVSMGGMM